MSKKAIIMGASGLIGSSLLQILLAAPQYDQVQVLVRKELQVKHPKLVQTIVDFDKLDGIASSLIADTFFSCLGSTKKKTPDVTDYRKVDHNYPLQLAQIAKTNQISQFHLVSSIGANASSSNFYTRMKGEVEDALIEIDLPALYIYRPSALAGERKESRPLEKISLAVMSVINPLLLGRLRKYRSIPAITVAMAMYKQSLKEEKGLFVFESDIINKLA